LVFVEGINRLSDPVSGTLGHGRSPDRDETRAVSYRALSQRRPPLVYHPTSVRVSEIRATFVSGTHSGSCRSFSTLRPGHDPRSGRSNPNANCLRSKSNALGAPSWNWEQGNVTSARKLSSMNGFPILCPLLSVS